MMVGAVMMVVKVAMIVAERETASLVFTVVFYTYFDLRVTLI